MRRSRDVHVIRGRRRAERRRSRQGAADLFTTETALYATAAMVIIAGIAFAWLATKSYRRPPPAPAEG